MAYDVIFDVIGKQDDGPFLYFYIFGVKQGLVDDIDEVSERVERICSDFFLVKNLNDIMVTILRSTFLLFQFLILFHYIIHCEKVLIRTNFVPI